MKLYGFFRSGAAYRVRIALNLKGFAFEQISRHLRKGEQRDSGLPGDQSAGPGADAGAGRRPDPHPVARHHRVAGRDASQSAAAAERPDPPRTSSAFAQAIACDTHPVQNLRVLQRVKALGGDDTALGPAINQEGLEAAERLITKAAGPVRVRRRSRRWPTSA